MRKREKQLTVGSSWFVVVSWWFVVQGRNWTLDRELRTKNHELRTLIGTFKRFEAVNGGSA
jgi:hypothetical protein